MLSELAALETEQKHVDSRAAVVERRLRSLMETGERERESAAHFTGHRSQARSILDSNKPDFLPDFFLLFLQEMTVMKRRG